jgi:hypothetical protein
MNAVVITIGLILLVVASVAAGVVLAGELQHRARVRLNARRHDLYTWEQELLTAAESRGCAVCALLRRRAELLRPPDDPNER